MNALNQMRREWNKPLNQIRRNLNRDIENLAKYDIYNQKLKEVSIFLKSKGFSEKSIKTYCSILEKVFDKLSMNFKEEQVENYLSYIDISPRTYNLYRTIINFYTKKYLDYSLQFKKAKVPKSLPNYITREEINKIIIHTSNIKHKIQLALMYSSGLRVYEVVRLKKYNFDLDNFQITIRHGKGNKDRQTMIKPNLIPVLKQYLNTFQDNDYLFPSGKYHISERTTQEVLKHGKKKANITREFSCHDLRHSFAVNCIDKGINIEDVRKMLGHSCLKTTQIYLQCKQTNMKEIALKLERNITQCVI